MNMASISTLIAVFILTCISAEHAKSEFVNVHCKSETTGQYGLPSLLECIVQVTQEVSNPEIRVVTWIKKGVAEPLLFFTEEKQEETEGYKFAEPSWNNKNMNVSLLITNTAVEHEGNYECMVITNSGDANVNINLKVTAKYKNPTVQFTFENLPQGADGALTCNSDGGYPKGELRWFDKHNSDWTKSSEMQAEQGKNGLFKLSSKLILYPGSNLHKYTCVVYNASGDKEGDATFEVPERRSGSGGVDKQLPGNPSKIVAPVVVIGSLIVGLLLLLLFLRRRSQQARRHSTTPLMAQHQEVCTCDVEEGDYQDKDKTCNQV